jgi:hypothetical protein
MEALTSSCPPGFDMWGAFVNRVCVLRVLVSPLSFLARFNILRAFWLVIFYLRWIRTWVDPFHIRMSSNSSRVHRSGWTKFYGWKTRVHRDFPLIGFVLGDDLLGLAYQLCGNPLCKVSSHSKLIWWSFGCWIDFFRELLENTRRVWYECRTCLVGQTFEFGAEIWWRPTSRCLEAVVKIL